MRAIGTVLQLGHAKNKDAFSILLEDILTASKLTLIFFRKITWTWKLIVSTSNRSLFHRSYGQKNVPLFLISCPCKLYASLKLFQVV